MIAEADGLLVFRLKNLLLATRTQLRSRYMLTVLVVICERQRPEHEYENYEIPFFFKVSRSRSLLQQSHKSKITFISLVRRNSDDHTEKDINFKKLMMNTRAVGSKSRTRTVKNS